MFLSKHPQLPCKWWFFFRPGKTRPTLHGGMTKSACGGRKRHVEREDEAASIREHVLFKLWRQCMGHRTLWCRSSVVVHLETLRSVFHPQDDLNSLLLVRTVRKRPLYYCTSIILGAQFALTTMPSCSLCPGRLFKDDNGLQMVSILSPRLPVMPT